MQTYDKQTRK